MRTHGLPLVVAACLALGGLVVGAMPAVAASSGAKPGTRVYKWTDDKGVIHYGDAIPPQYADQDTTVMNQQGVPVGAIPGRRTPQQIEAAARAKAREDRASREALIARQRDQNLLATYLTVEEIESLRDRRVEILDGQSRVTMQYLEQQRARLRQLEQQAARHKPYSTAANATRLPDAVAEDLVRMANDIRSQEYNLEINRRETAKLKEQFARDIARFRELKNIESEYVRATQPR